MSLLYALFLTIIIEGLVMLTLARSKKWVYYNLLVNLVTNPLLNLALTVFRRVYRDEYQYWIAVAIGEIIVFNVEAALYRAMTGETWKKCYIRSIVTNGLSFLIGLLIMWQDRFI